MDTVVIPLVKKLKASNVFGSSCDEFMKNVVGGQDQTRTMFFGINFDVPCSPVLIYGSHTTAKSGNRMVVSRDIVLADRMVPLPYILQRPATLNSPNTHITILYIFCSSPPFYTDSLVAEYSRSKANQNNKSRVSATPLEDQIALLALSI